MFERVLTPPLDGTTKIYENLSGVFLLGDVCSFKIQIPESADLNDMMYIRIEYLDDATATLIKGTTFDNPQIMYSMSAGPVYTATQNVNFYLLFQSTAMTSGKFVFSIWFNTMPGTGQKQPKEVTYEEPVVPEEPIEEVEIVETPTVTTPETTTTTTNTTTTTPVTTDPKTSTTTTTPPKTNTTTTTPEAPKTTATTTTTEILNPTKPKPTETITNTNDDGPLIFDPIKTTTVFKTNSTAPKNSTSDSFEAKPKTTNTTTTTQSTVKNETKAVDSFEAVPNATTVATIKDLEDFVNTVTPKNDQFFTESDPLKEK